MKVRLFPRTLKKPFLRWTAAEDARMVEMRNAGASLRAIARDINRPYESILIRLRKKHGIYKHRPRYACAPVRTAICLADVPAYYELGWRFVEFAPQAYLFEWPAIGEPRYPAEEVRRAA